MKRRETSLALLRMLGRLVGWLPASDIYAAFGCEGRQDHLRHNRVAVALKRLRVSKLVEADDSVRPWRYRITAKGVAVLERERAEMARAA
jgi:hypothetical protein